MDCSRVIPLRKSMFDDSSGNRVMAQLEISIVNSVAEGTEEVEHFVSQNVAT
jgi:hypothetical protein